MAATGPEMQLPSKFDSDLAAKVSTVIDSLNTMGYQLRQLPGMQIDDYKHDCEQVMRRAAEKLHELADSVRGEYSEVKNTP